MRIQRVDKIVELMAWKMECDRIKEELEWWKAMKAGIEYSRACKEKFANGVTWYSV